MLGHAPCTRRDLSLDESLLIGQTKLLASSWVIRCTHAPVDLSVIHLTFFSVNMFVSKTEVNNLLVQLETWSGRVTEHFIYL